MFPNLSNQSRAERDSLLTHIASAFANVSRGEQAMSWRECYAYDIDGPEYHREAVRVWDTDTHWSQLVDRPSWVPFPGVGGFSFINAEGFRYYLPPTMIRFLRGEDVHEAWALLAPIDQFTTNENLPLWTEPQLQTIARFIDFMARHDPDALRDPDDPNQWANAITQRWHSYLP
ncbi:MAG: DUF6714 family protein [Phycisphaerales bacterium]